MLLLSISISVSAQKKLTKISESIKVTDNVTIDLNTSYVEIEVDTWNKNTLEIEAYIEDEKLSKDELEKALKNWNIEVEGSGDYVSIRSKGSPLSTWTNYDFDYNFSPLVKLELELVDLPEMPEMPEMPELVEIQEFNFPEMPEMPEIPELPEGIKSVHFDTEAYKKEGEVYLQKWSKEYELKYGAEFKERMEDWAKKMAKVDFSTYEKDMEKWGEKYGKKFGKDYQKKMEVYAKQLEERFSGEWAEKMEAWGERYAEQMEERAAALEQRNAALEKRIAERELMKLKRDEKVAKRLEERQKIQELRTLELKNSLKHHLGDKVKKTIKIKMPKDAKLKMNVRHGELKFSSVIKNLKADISHATLVANHIDGSETSINVSYSPVLISTWSLGELKLNHVSKAKITTVDRLVLNSNSSNTIIGTLIGNAIIDGSFGDLSIINIADTFNNLNVIIENSDAVIALPKTDFNLQYKGNRSRFSHPESSTTTNISNYSTGNLSSNKTIVLNAKYSNVIMQ